jgi:methyl-accepting chemotaxis protein
VFANLRISLRLAIGFGVVIFLLLGTAVVGVTRMSALDDAAGLMSSDIYPKSITFNKLIMSLDALEISMRNALIGEDPEQVRAELAIMTDLKKASDENLLQVGKILSSPKGKEMYVVLRANEEKYAAGLNDFKKLVAAGNKQGAVELLHGSLRRDIQAFRDGMFQMTVLGGQLMKNSSANINALYSNSLTIIAGLTAAAILLAVAFAYWVTRSITLPLGHAIHFARNVAAGDLSHRIETSARDETGHLIAALMDMNDGLSDMVAKVRQSAQAIGTASTEIAAGNLDLSSRTEQQAGSLEETASAMEQLTSTVQHNADNAREASQLAESASGIAAEGGVVVGQVVDTMSLIDASSKKIVDIISVIDSIAFQTNILALNAAVEAARAGEQGRGFAVVASEVRSLAQRSAEAAREIKALIGDSVEKVSTGTQLVQLAGATMTTVMSSVSKVNEIVAQISAASREQSVGIDEVNRAITQMDQATQQNAALVEQAAAAAQSMQDQAVVLNKMVSVFRFVSDENMQDISATRIKRLS